MKPHVPFELAVPVGAIDHVIGAPHAVATVVEYGDFECPNCKQAQPAVRMLLERFSGRVRFVFRHFPLEEVHPHALNAAQAAESAGGQGKFWEMHDLLFANQEHLKATDLRGYAERLGLDMARYIAEMDDQVYLQRVREQLQSGLDSGVRATPTFFVNGRIEDVSFGLRALFDVVEGALHRNAGR
ncbi:MAG: thioredoxin domain-containing protein [Gammaproteobacteria bacterium]|nr:thioredoxin domain-containing protein [Gammaproteobacteria bacterium]MBV9727250.1 thioredoxin domain-containing protein [Gammaproteobacteria bacterium]